MGIDLCCKISLIFYLSDYFCRPRTNSDFERDLESA